MGRTSPQTLLGQLQRGRGAGWLAALKVGKADLLLECLFSDPRWDTQVEDRADYYGSLARELNLTAATVVTAPMADEEDARFLRLDVLAAMARRGDLPAIGLLRDLFQDNTDNQHIAYLLSELPGGLDGIDRLITSRLSPEGLTTFVLWTRTMLPWEQWVDAHPKIAAAIAKFDAKSKTSKPAPPDVGAPLEIILAHGWWRPPDDVVERFVHLATVDEIALLRRAVTGPSAPARYFALRVLGERQDPCALDLAEQTFAANTSGRDRGTVYQYIRKLRAADTLPLARRWLDAGDDRSGVATTLMALHSMDSDVPSIRAALTRAWEERDMYALCSLIEALGRHPAGGPYEELRTIFTDVDYSYARTSAAAAMAKVDASFAGLFASECLWDCEPDTQVTGVETVGLADARMVERVRQLATSEYEDRDVAVAAVSRLNRYRL